MNSRSAMSSETSSTAFTSPKFDGAVPANVVSMADNVIGVGTIGASAIGADRFYGSLRANVTQVNSVLVSGVGTSANPWRPA